MNVVETQSWNSGSISVPADTYVESHAEFTFSSEVKGIASIQATNKFFTVPSQNPENFSMFIAPATYTPTYPNVAGQSAWVPTPAAIIPPIEIDGNVVRVATLRRSIGLPSDSISLQIHLTVFI